MAGKEVFRQCFIDGDYKLYEQISETNANTNFKVMQDIQNKYYFL